MEKQTAKVTAAPVKYVQQPGLLRQLGKWCRPWCTAGGVLVLAEGAVLREQAAAIRAGFTREGLAAELTEFGGECCMAEISRLRGLLMRTHGQIIVGIGGDKLLDTAKAAAHYHGCAAALAPTEPCSSAACGAQAMLYTEDGRPDRHLRLEHDPPLVLADSAVIAAAPVRLLAAGMGEALAAWYEARACLLSGGETDAGGATGAAALALARGCRDILLGSGLRALDDAKNGRLTNAVEQVIEVNLYLSGVASESGGLAAAHAVHGGLAGLGVCPGALRGETVAFGTLVQLALENDRQELARAMEFCKKAGLPTTLEALGCPGLGPELLLLAAEKACAPETSMGNMPFAVTPQQVCRAVLAVDALGREA